MSRASRFASPFHVRNGRSFRLRHVDPGETGRIRSKKEAVKWLDRGVARLFELQEKFYTQDYGFGFRFNADHRVVMRADAGFGSRDGKHLYIIFGERF